MAKQGVLNEIVSDSTISTLDSLLSKLGIISSEIDAINKKKINLPSEGRSNSQSSANANRQLNQTLSEQERLIERLNNARKEEAVELAKLRLELAKQNKENKAAAESALGMLNEYQKLNRELNELRNQARNVAAQMFNLEQAGEQNSDAYRELSATYDHLSRRVNLLNTGLTNIDRGLGDHRRNVGNYESAWNGLGNAINQLTREAPAFAVSLNTGFLAISNNLPILVDEITRLSDANARMREQGQPTVSVLKQIASALFSWQTALSVGVTLLTVYGKEIANWVSSLFSAKKALDALTQAQATLNNVRLKSQKDIIDEITSYKLYLSTASDTTKSYEERQIAVKKLQQEYAFYFGKLSEQQIMSRDPAEAERELNKALEARSNVAGISDAYNKNQAKILDIQRAIGTANTTISKEYIRQNELRKEASRTGKVIEGAIDESIKKYNSASVALEKLTPELLRLEEAQQLLIKSGIKYKKEAIGLEYSPEEETKKVKTQIAELADYEANRFALIQQRLENERTIEGEIVQDEEVNLQRREQAREAYYNLSQQMAENEYNEEIRLISNRTDAEIAELKRRGKEGEITQKNMRETIAAIEGQAFYDNLNAYAKYQASEHEITNKRKDDLKGVADAIRFATLDNLIDAKELATTDAYVAKIQELVANNADLRDIEKAQAEFAGANASLEKERAAQAISNIETELSALEDTAENVQKRIDLEGKLIAAKQTYANLTKKQADEEAAALIKLQKATENYLNTIADGTLGELGFDSLNIFTKLEENGKTTFENLMAGADKMGEKFGVAFNAISSVAKDTFAFLNQNQQAYFDAQQETLRRVYEINQRFAGDSEEAQAELQRQYEERQREIRIKEAQAAKETAVFNAIINTAQGVTSALATGRIALSVIIGALGAAQIAAIANRPIPAYAEGTDYHAGGLAWVGDGGKREVIQYPGGKMALTPAKDTLIDLPKGSKVFPDIATAAIANAAIGNVAAMQGGMSEAAMERVMLRTLGSQPQNAVIMDKKGITTVWGSAHGKRVDFNNRVTFKSVKNR